ncbi:MAG: hypothetical protein FWC42_04430 [Proteobacteria bacterium]|nr:hypothetical protein [Pseudomonadota bacterium]MCL2309510.1 hypothetical protein [Pseudomonadota bacterium]
MRRFSLPTCFGVFGLLTLSMALFASPAFSSDAMRVEGAPVISTKAEAVVSWRAAPDARKTTVVTFAPLPTSALEAVQEENSPDSARKLQAKPTKIGVNRNADTESHSAMPFSLNWQNIGDGHVARLAVTSPEARGMRVALRLRVLPDSAELRFSGSGAPEKILGAVSGKEANALRDDSKVYWTPATEGKTQNIEIYLPATVRTEDVKVRLNAVSHLFTSAQNGFNASAVTKASQYCEVDVACKFDSLGVAFKNTASAVARMLFSDSSGSWLCTGTLLNNTSGSQTPYFWTAAHCISTQSAANSLNTYWFYETAGCNSLQLNSNYQQLSGGAQLLFTKTSTDTTLLRLNNAAPTGAYLASWDANRFSGSAITGIHHPAGDAKKVSAGKGDGRTCDAVFDSDSVIDISSLSLVSWSEGATEGGSSGSGLFTLSNGVYYLRGGLMGGASSCYYTGDPVDDGNNADCYSSLNLVYNDIKQWLAPGAAPMPPSSSFGPTRQYTGQWIKANSDGQNDENNWGLTVLMNFPYDALYIFVPWYTYDSSGKASWYIFQGNVWSANDVFSADVFRYTGPAWGAMPYDNSKITNTKVGTAKLTFTSATTAIFTYNVEGSGRTINLVKLE